MKLWPALPEFVSTIYSALFLSLSPFNLHTREPARKSQPPASLSCIASTPPILSCPPMLAKSVLHELPPATRRYHITRAKAKLLFSQVNTVVKFNVNPTSTNVPLFSTLTNSFTRSPSCFFTNLVLIWLRTRTTGYSFSLVYTSI